MEKELREIFDKNNFGFGEIDVDNAVKDILRLFNVCKQNTTMQPISREEIEKLAVEVDNYLLKKHINPDKIIKHDAHLTTESTCTASILKQLITIAIVDFNKCAELNAGNKRQVTNTGSFQTGV